MRTRALSSSGARRLKHAAYRLCKYPHANAHGGNVIGNTVGVSKMSVVTKNSNGITVAVPDIPVPYSQPQHRPLRRHRKGKQDGHDRGQPSIPEGLQLQYQHRRRGWHCRRWRGFRQGEKQGRIRQLLFRREGGGQERRPCVGPHAPQRRPPVFAPGKDKNETKCLV